MRRDWEGGRATLVFSNPQSSLARILQLLLVTWVSFRHNAPARFQDAPELREEAVLAPCKRIPKTSPHRNNRSSALRITSEVEGTQSASQERWSQELDDPCIAINTAARKRHRSRFEAGVRVAGHIVCSKPGSSCLDWNTELINHFNRIEHAKHTNKTQASSTLADTGT
jgi:hypothetical protein